MLRKKRDRQDFKTNLEKELKILQEEIDTSPKKLIVTSLEQS